MLLTASYAAETNITLSEVVEKVAKFAYPLTTDKLTIYQQKNEFNFYNASTN